MIKRCPATLSRGSFIQYSALAARRRSVPHKICDFAGAPFDWIDSGRPTLGLPASDAALAARRRSAVWALSGSCSDAAPVKFSSEIQKSHPAALPRGGVSFFTNAPCRTVFPPPAGRHWCVPASPGGRSRSAPGHSGPSRHPGPGACPPPSLPGRAARCP